MRSLVIRDGNVVLCTAEQPRQSGDKLVFDEDHGAHPVTAEELEKAFAFLGAFDCVVGELNGAFHVMPVRDRQFELAEEVLRKKLGAAAKIEHRLADGDSYFVALMWHPTQKFVKLRSVSDFEDCICQVTQICVPTGTAKTDDELIAGVINNIGIDADNVVFGVVTYGPTDPRVLTKDEVFVLRHILQVLNFGRITFVRGQRPTGDLDKKKRPLLQELHLVIPRCDGAEAHDKTRIERAKRQLHALGCRNLTVEVTKKTVFKVLP